MLLSHLLLMKATVFRSVLLSAVGQYPAPCCRTTLPAAFTPRSKLSYTGVFVGCSEGASGAEVLLGWPWQPQPQQKAAVYWPGENAWPQGEHQDGAGADEGWGDPTVLLGQHPIRHPARWQRSCPHTSGRSRSPGAGMSDPACHARSGPHLSLGRHGSWGCLLCIYPVPIHIRICSACLARLVPCGQAGRGGGCSPLPWSQWST